jgi:hypothetical protein
MMIAGLNENVSVVFTADEADCLMIDRDKVRPAEAKNQWSILPALAAEAGSSRSRARLASSR